MQVAALSCLHSLSRSVKQLRTNLLDAEVWQPLLKLIKTDDDELVRTSSRTLCNLLLDFSPSKVRLNRTCCISPKFSEHESLQICSVSHFPPCSVCQHVTCQHNTQLPRRSCWNRKEQWSCSQSWSLTPTMKLN